MSHSRRTALRAAGVALLSSWAGCSALSHDSAESEDVTFERLDVTPVYVEDGAELSTPAEVETVDQAYNAELLVLSGNTDATSNQAVEWLADDRIVALLGDSPEATWLEWARSDAFRDTFSNEGYSDAEPDPSLVVGARIGLYLKTYRRSWSDGPRNRDVLRALDESLVAIEKETPPGE
ncbi:hypothetical protein [Haloarcula onubensis]|uniref:Uncharacterized protein n=1 Tax=Haloarcula onubensis TaxID=2950539 RepID=A0ABU2FLN7_9EURY|nr:hypothetical protein [Halomicroarcula sp. S3CR25-11]MDS0281686.1 hypothetical protein [Halomicroarcula sp. S3CR25-11]